MATYNRDGTLTLSEVEFNSSSRLQTGKVLDSKQVGEED